MSKKLIVYMPVICQNGHTAVATYEIKNLEAVYKGVPSDENCSCLKHGLGQGWRANGDPFVKSEEVVEGIMFTAGTMIKRKEKKQGVPSIYIVERLDYESQCYVAYVYTFGPRQYYVIPFTKQEDFKLYHDK